MSFNPECPSSCPFAVAREESLSFPVGQVHRIDADEQEVDETKRNVLKLLAVAGIVGIGVGGGVAGALQYAQPPTIGIGSYPRVQLLDVSGQPLTVDSVMKEYNSNSTQVYTFAYPLLNEPNFLLNLSPAVHQALNGIGPTGGPQTIVAFSAICQHLGCPAPAIAYYPPGTCPNTPGGKTLYIHCSCHGSTYDPANGAANLTGPAVLPLPQVVLEADDDGNIFAIGMTPSSPPVNGHINTLQGDYGVGNTSQLSSQAPVILCQFPQ
ncbi:MAG: Rieske 2Fe-2S domain-containing protein [Thermoplasmata archaeon]